MLQSFVFKSGFFSLRPLQYVHYIVMETFSLTVLVCDMESDLAGELHREIALSDLEQHFHREVECILASVSCELVLIKRVMFAQDAPR